MARYRCGTCASRGGQGRCRNVLATCYGRYVGYDRQVCAAYDRAKALQGVRALPEIGTGLADRPEGET